MAVSGIESYSISQVYALTNVPKSTIRFWEKEFGDFLSPTRTEGNQRRYTAADVEAIRKINELVNVDLYTLAGARKKLSAGIEKGQAVDLSV